MLARSPFFHTLLLGVLGRTCFCHLPLSCQLALGGNGQSLVLTLAVAPGQNPGEVVWPLHPPQILDPTGRAVLKEGGRALLWPNPVVPPVSSLGSSLAVMTQRVGTDVQLASGDRLAQHLYLLLQGNHSS